MLPVASLLPSLFHATDTTGCPCPVSVDTHSKVSAEPTVHIFTKPSQLPVASMVPSLFQTTDKTACV
jgi:hypothetical protein